MKQSDQRGNNFDRSQNMLGYYACWFVFITAFLLGK